MFLTPLIVLALIGFGCYLKNRQRIPSGMRLPPGPRGLPLIGQFFHMKDIVNPDILMKWRKKYGDIMSINVFGRCIVFIHSPDIAQELFEKKGSIYSDRPPSHMCWSLGWENNPVLMPYGDWWRRHKRALGQFLNSRAVLTFEPTQTRLQGRLIRNLLQTPQQFVEHLRYAAGSIVLNTMYALDVKPRNDPYLNLVHHALEGVGEAAITGIFILDWFPILKHIPDWVPGIPFKEVLKKYGGAAAQLFDIPFSIVKNHKNPDYSFVSASLERLEKSDDALPDAEVVIKNVAGVAYIAGAGSTFTAVLNGCLAILLHPEVQRKAQAELDEILGDRLPAVEDRKKLPYINAICNEILRWRPIAPLALPHAVMEDDIYGNYFIPKGSMVIGSSGFMLLSEKYGPEPAKFDPDRFFQTGVPVPIE